MNILYVNTNYLGGGAERVARQLFLMYKGNTLDNAFFFEGKKTCSEDHVSYGYDTKAVIWQFNRVKNFVTNNARMHDLYTRSKIDAIIKKNNIDIVHFHNLHGNYIGIKDVHYFAKKVKVVVTLHDMWSMTGHCAYSMNCDRWKIGCGRCPHLGRYPKMWVDLTRKVLSDKKKSFGDKNICFVTPSVWLKTLFDQSIIPHNEADVIYNGVDCDIFKKIDATAHRKRLGIDNNKTICLCLANSLDSEYKGIRVLLDAIEKIPCKNRFSFIFIGKQSECINISDVDIIKVEYVGSVEELNSWYSLADVMLIPSMAENFPCVILEAFASGTPVIGSNVGGIPEVVDENTGWLFDVGDSDGLCRAIDQLPANDVLKNMGYKCREKVKNGFSESQMRAAYKKLYSRVLSES